MSQQEILYLLGEMTLDEKIGMIHGDALFQTKGIKRLGIPPLKMSDGPMGVRKEFQKNKWTPLDQGDDYVSYLPSNTALASTWNEELAYEAGKVLGEEARGRGKDVILAPGINIQRSPLCGRNFEYMSEDPCLIARLVVPFIKGIQESDVAACVKHFAVNNQETRRLDVEVKVSERALHEIYFPGFKAAVLKGKSHTIMGAYNKLKNQHCCHNEYLLYEVLKKDWSFDGVVISDWGGVHDTTQAAFYGLDIEMSVTDHFDEYYLANPLKEKIENGEIKVSVLDEKVMRILQLMDKLHMLKGIRKTGTFNTRKHQDTLLEVARESIVLLKNEDNRLPLKKEGLKKLAVIGDNAKRIHSNGGGSAEIKALYEISPILGLTMFLGGNTEIEYAKGYYADTIVVDEKKNWQESSLEGRIAKEQYKENKSDEMASLQEKLRKEAVLLAKESEEVVLFCGLNHDFDSEGKDKISFKLPYEQELLIEEVLKVNPNTIIAIIAGSPIDMEVFSKKAKAILYCSYAGMEGGNALAQVLFGEVNPSGKLPMTIPRSLGDCPAHKLGEFPGEDSVTYQEDIFVGYRFFDTYQIDERFCFGHGLSYTQFSYENLEIKFNEQEGFFPLEVSLKVKNIGEQAGKETVQVYVGNKNQNILTPAKELRSFQKIWLEAGESKSLTFSLDESSFSYYSEDQKCFVTDAGNYVIYVGSSVKDIRLNQEVVIK